MTISEKIKAIRKERGLTQKQFGDLCGIHEVQIRKYERGEVTPKMESIKKIADGLGVPPSDLIGPEWFDMKVGPDKVDEIQKEVTIQQGMIAILADLYGCAETKEVSSASGWCQPYYLIGTPPNSFILHEDTIETLVSTTKAFLPALIDQLKETRPEELVVQEIQRELEKIPKPEK